MLAGLFWTNKDAALTILAKLLQAEMLLMLGAQSALLAHSFAVPCLPCWNTVLEA